MAYGSQPAATRPPARESSALRNSPSNHRDRHVLECQDVADARRVGFCFFFRFDCPGSLRTIQEAVAAAAAGATILVCPGNYRSTVTITAAVRFVHGRQGKERAGHQVDGQRAQFRRLEVWIVPGGAAMPAGLTGLQDAPAVEVKKLGCPR